jgi:hypothetical protein
VMLINEGGPANKKKKEHHSDSFSSVFESCKGSNYLHGMMEQEQKWNEEFIPQSVGKQRLHSNILLQLLSNNYSSETSDSNDGKQISASDSLIKKVDIGCISKQLTSLQNENNVCPSSA